MFPSTPPLLLTRPAAQSARFAADCRARFGTGLAIVISPLLHLRDIPLTLDPALFDGLIFTSENGVGAFVRHVAGRHWPVWCVGPRTADAARRAGFGVQEAGGDAAALLREFHGQGKWLHLRGAYAAGDLAQRLDSAGTEMAEAVIYAQDALPLSSEGRALLNRAQDLVVPLFSPRTAQLFSDQAQGVPARLWMLALSPAVAASIRVPGASLAIAARPNGAAMLDALSDLLQSRGSA